MKVRVKETGEILSIAEYDRVKVDHCDSYGTPIEFGYDEVEFIQDETSTKAIDWEQRRFELTKAALHGFCANQHPRCVDAHTSEFANWSICAADAVIEKLKAE